jgi:hypothetical protein
MGLPLTALRRLCLLRVIGVDTLVLIVASPRCWVLTRGEYATSGNIKERSGLNGYEAILPGNIRSDQKDYPRYARDIAVVRH